MKTSTKLLLIGALIVIVSLATYNVALRAEYNRGEFRNPYRDYTALTLRDFDEVDLAPGSRLNVTLEAGPFAVWQHQELDSVRVEQVGRRLRLTDLHKGGRRRYEADVIVRCPSIVGVAVNALGADGRRWRETDQTASVRIKGFRQDSLLVTADQAASVALADNQLRSLRVVAGAAPGSTAEVSIAQSNTIDAARLDFRHRSSFSLDALTIPDLRYQFADSARASLPASALQVLARH